MHYEQAADMPLTHEIPEEPLICGVVERAAGAGEEVRDEATAMSVHKLIEIIQSLSPAAHEQVFDVLSAHGCRYTENANGVFVNLSHAPTACVSELRGLVRFWSDQRQHIRDSERRRDALQQVLEEVADGVEEVEHRGAAMALPSGAAAARTGSPSSATSCATATAHTANASLGSPTPATASSGYNALFHTDSSVPLFDNSVHQHLVDTLTPAQQLLIGVSDVSTKRRAVGLNKAGKNILRRGGAASRLAKKCIATDEDA